VAVDPLSWAVNLGLTTLARGTFDAVFRSLSAKLENAVSSWSNDLPADVRFNAEALCVCVNCSDKKKRRGGQIRGGYS
jgi:hypothetical protein